jgi:hypothetical protein
MFNAALKPPPKGMKGKWTEFPHPNHPSLASLIARCHQLYDEDPRRAPTILFIKEGDYEVGAARYLEIKYPMKIIGAGQDKTSICGGGFRIGGKKEEAKEMYVQGMTMIGSSDCGMVATNGLSFLCKDMTFTQCRFYGVMARNTKGRLINCVITQCKYSGIYCHENALIELEGGQTKVDENVTNGYGSSYGSSYGLNTYSTSSIIHLLFPLTKESVSTNNHNGQNHGGRGTIDTVASFNISTTSTTTN